ncbi:uncharacterized protein RAG0_06455 [Rhynchosporium agropyri]|uniref:Uncharacterized protein n=1 Tax=Rhynchosporium agropyri TaxID=914238 RepID=A0A1E1KH33_9HELO|nr:uncharacterized protein RAG0_06455 [Rhynchosporium agropyri]
MNFVKKAAQMNQQHISFCYVALLESLLALLPSYNPKRPPKNKIDQIPGPNQIKSQPTHQQENIHLYNQGIGGERGIHQRYKQQSNDFQKHYPKD